MNNKHLLIDMLDEMKSSRVSNYIIAGLDSYLIDRGMVRMFHNTRNHQDQITPHSHRFNFACLVLEGTVTNKIWQPCGADQGDLFQSTEIKYMGEFGKYEYEPISKSNWDYKSQKYTAGDCYEMVSSQVHSIDFSKGAKVLFFEGESISDTSLMIEPVVDDEVIKTSMTADYMFRKGV